MLTFADESMLAAINQLAGGMSAQYVPMSEIVTATKLTEDDVRGCAQNLGRHGLVAGGGTGPLGLGAADRYALTPRAVARMREAAKPPVMFGS